MLYSPAGIATSPNTRSTADLKAGGRIRSQPPDVRGLQLAQQLLSRASVQRGAPVLNRNCFAFKAHRGYGAEGSPPRPLPRSLPASARSVFPLQTFSFDPPQDFDSFSVTPCSLPKIVPTARNVANASSVPHWMVIDAPGAGLCQRDRHGLNRCIRLRLLQRRRGEILSGVMLGSPLPMLFVEDQLPGFVLPAASTSYRPRSGTQTSPKSKSVSVVNAGEVQSPRARLRPRPTCPINHQWCGPLQPGASVLNRNLLAVKVYHGRPASGALRPSYPRERCCRKYCQNSHCELLHRFLLSRNTSEGAIISPPATLRHPAGNNRLWMRSAPARWHQRPVDTNAKSAARIEGASFTAALYVSQVPCGYNPQTGRVNPAPPADPSPVLRSSPD